MMRRILLSLLLLSFVQPAMAEIVHSPEAITLAGPMVADISTSAVQIHSSFNGAELLVFGARNSGGDLIVAVRGPQANMVVRRKERIAGMWMHVEKRRYNELPLFYAIASTRPLEKIASPVLLNQLQLGESSVIAHSNRFPQSTFDNALQRLLERKGTWQEPFGTVTYFGESLFKARLHLPDTLPEGTYSVEVYLIKSGRILAFQTLPLLTYKTGFDARIYNAAQQEPWSYGLFAILMALIGGWLGHRLFSKH